MPNRTSARGLALAHSAESSASWGWVDEQTDEMHVLNPETAERSWRLEAAMIPRMGGLPADLRLHLYPLVGLGALLVLIVVLTTMHLIPAMVAIQVGAFGFGGLVLGSKAIDDRIERRRVAPGTHRDYLATIHRTLAGRVTDSDLHAALWESAESLDAAKRQRTAAVAVAQALDERAEIEAAETTLAALARDLSEENELRRDALNDVAERLSSDSLSDRAIESKEEGA